QHQDRAPCDSSRDLCPFPGDRAQPACSSSGTRAGTPEPSVPRTLHQGLLIPGGLLSRSLNPPGIQYRFFCYCNENGIWFSTVVIDPCGNGKFCSKNPCDLSPLLLPGSMHTPVLIDQTVFWRG